MDVCSECGQPINHCPKCGEVGTYDSRVLVNGRGVYTCPQRHRWQDHDEESHEQ